MPTKSTMKATGLKGQAKPTNTKESPTMGGSKSVTNHHDSSSERNISVEQQIREPLSQQPPHASNQSGEPQQPPTNQPLADGLVRDHPVNRKKQKRRIKEAAKRAAERVNSMESQTNFHNGSGQSNGYDYAGSDFEGEEQEDLDDARDAYYQDDALQQEGVTQSGLAKHKVNGHFAAKDRPETRNKRKDLLSVSDDLQHSYNSSSRTIPAARSSHSHPNSLPREAHHSSKDRIWNTSTAEERERIKQFWLSLGESDRRSLVKVEKEAVLKKMKEQQKHSCSCTVCGRKRTAIEEELEVLYDAYYEELEQYANTEALTIDDGGIRAARMYSHPMSRNAPIRNSQSYGRQSSRAQIHEIQDEDDGFEEDDESEAVEDDDLSDDYIGQEPQPTPAAAEFFNFGRSLTVQEGVLTVADDLLKNDGKKFIEMMEQLAERRMQREEDAQYAASGISMQHNHPGASDEEIYDDEDDEEDYDSQEDEEFEEDEMDTMTEDQRMEEGRRMFQIFAARMFEQRVLTAYREKVALERQQKLIEELDDESRVDAQREAKKAKEAQKRKEKKRQQKQAKDEEKARREAEKAAEEAAAKALEEKKAEEQRLKKEEQRKKREAEKKAHEEERARKEAEKQKRLQEAKELQAEQERKQREQREREKRKKEESKKREREEREAKEKEAKDRKEREALTKREQGPKSAPGPTIKEQAKKEEIHASSKPIVSPSQILSKRASPATLASASSLGLHPPPTTTSSHTSPHLTIATPIVPKAPPPIRPRQPSYQDSHTTSPKSTQPAVSATASPKAANMQYGATHINSGSSNVQPTPSHTYQIQPRYSPKQIPPGSAPRPQGFSTTMNNSGPGFDPSYGKTISELIGPFAPNIQSSASANAHHAGFTSTAGVSYPSMHESLAYTQSRGKMEPPPLQPPANARSTAPYGDLGHPATSRDNAATQNHSRNTSTSSNVAAQTQPIARPTPIQRPSSTTPQQQSSGIAPNRDIDDLTNHLGSKALLDDDDGPYESTADDARRGNMAPGGPRRSGFAGPPGLQDPIGHTRHENPTRALPSGVTGTWSAQQSPFGHPASPWPAGSGFGRAVGSKGFGAIGAAPFQHSTARAIAVRNLIANACHKLSARSPMGPLAGWHHADDIHRDVQLSRPQHIAPVGIDELLELCDTAGNAQNGGGSFELFTDQAGAHIRFHPGRNSAAGNVPGEIGSPIGGGPSIFGGPSRPFQHHGNFPPSTGF